ncbi:MAG TPA: STAS domain-containing protein [Flavipsychrobacter sp.]|nr:STAS domain-containing protein [Flavipsychrobacter sp.]
MIIKVKQQEKYTSVIIAEREASLKNAEAFKTEMMQLVDTGATNMILNFSQVTYVDSSFLGSLVASLKYAISKGSDIYLVELQKDIYDLLHLIRMNKVFKIFDSEEQAVASL